MDELRNKVAALRDEIEKLAAIDNITPEDDARLDAALEEFEARKAELEASEARAARIAAAKAVVTERAVGFDAPQVIKSAEQVDVRTASRKEMRDAALRIAEKAGLAVKTIRTACGPGAWETRPDGSPGKRSRAWAATRCW